MNTMNITNITNTTNIKTKSVAFITAAGYLSITKEYLDNTRDTTITVNNIDYSIVKLCNTITYKDNVLFYRWSKKAFNKCIIV